MKDNKVNLSFVVLENNYSVNQGLATLAFFGVGVNLVLFLTRVMGQDNADAANDVSKWTGTVYLFSLVGAFLSDSYWGRYKTCAIFQAIFVIVSFHHLMDSNAFPQTHGLTSRQCFQLPINIYIVSRSLDISQKVQILNWSYVYVYLTGSGITIFINIHFLTQA